MKFAIIAAGEGSRLAQEGVKQPKPLVLIEGQPMIRRLMDIFMRSGADSITVIINNEVPATKEYLYELQQHYPLNLVVKTTAGSMESLYQLIPYLEGDQFCLTTVDTIFHEAEFTTFIEHFREAGEDGYMAVTDFIDDEKPLYIAANEEMDITGYYDQKNEDCNYISGGIYCLTSSCLDTLKRCREKGYTRMRQFQKALVEEGKLLKAYPFSKILDVDHADDIEKAENFLKEPFPIIGIERSHEYSPNKESSDSAIFRRVKEELENKGYRVLPFSEERLLQQPIFSPFCYTMGRRTETLEVLTILEEEGCKVLNSPSGVENADRIRMTTYLKAAGIPLPQCTLLDTRKSLNEQTPLAYPCWIKRGNGYSQLKNDVVYVRNPKEAENALNDMSARNIPVAVVNLHLEGDLIKFYGVSNSDEPLFFHWYYPSPTEGSKFGLEAINGEANGYTFDENELQDLCHKAACTLHLQVYGGDAVIDREGTIRIIDFNDWPSFAPCRDKAAKAIAQLIIDQYSHYEFRS